MIPIPAFLNSMKFGGASSTRGTVTSTAAITNLDPHTVFALVNRTSNVGGVQILGKGQGTDNTRRIQLGAFGGTDLRYDIDRATADLIYNTSAGMFLPNIGWQWVAAVFDSTAAAGALVKFYWSFLGQPFANIPATTATDGSGAFQSDSGKTLCVGNNSGNTSAFQGDIAYVGLCAAALTPAELIAIQSRLFDPIRGLRGLWLPGLSGGVSIPDLSGLGHHAVITGAVPSGNQPPLPQLSSRTVVKAFRARLAA